jgi:hypothetical protein
MNDDKLSAQLSALRAQPSPEFADGLRARLRADAAAPAPERAHWPIARLAASVGLVAVTGALFTVPAVRASAQSLLARFRVVNFVAVQIDEGRVAALRSKELDLPDLIGEHVQILQEPAAPIVAASPERPGRSPDSTCGCRRGSRQKSACVRSDTAAQGICGSSPIPTGCRR